MSEDVKVKIINSDMIDEMQQDAVHCAVQAYKKYKSLKDISADIKKVFDEKYHPNWYCIVGRHFGSSVTRKEYTLMYLYLDEVAILLYKSG